MTLRGVLLDTGSMHSGDLNLDGLLGQLDACQLHDFTAPADVAERIRDCEVVLTNKARLEAAHFAGCPTLRLVVVLATGTNNVDLKAAREAGVTVCNVRDYATTSLAEHCLMLMLALVRNLNQYQRDVQAGRWSAGEHFCLLDHPIQQLAGSALGIIGLGASGRAVAALARAFGMKVLALESATGAGDTTGILRLPLDDLLDSADVVSIHCPLTARTEGLIDRRSLRRMKRSAVLVNTARGGIVDESDLAEALREGWIAGAAVDVLSAEPPPSEHPLLRAQHPNLIITPHNAWGSRDARQGLVDQAAEVIAAFRRGEALNVV